jgi:hypothetical protein
MSGSVKEVESPLDFNECVSRDKLTRLLDDQRTYMNGNLMSYCALLTVWSPGLNMLNNGGLHGGPDNNHLMVRWMRSTMAMMPTLMLMHVMQIFFSVIVMVWEVIIIEVIMILLLK